MRTITLQFPGNKKVDALFEEFVVHTDQRLASGGDQSAPNPFDLFFVSLATCAGISALEYCQHEQISSEGLAVTLKAHRHPVQPRYDRIVIEVTPPPGLSEKQIEALIDAARDCTVKRHILTPPEIVVCTPETNDKAL